MYLYIAKVLVSACMVVAISEIAKRSTFAAALVASIPLTSILAFIWLQVETGDTEKITALSSSILWLVVPSFAFFIFLPRFLKFGWGFWPSLIAAIAVTGGVYGLFILLMKKFGIDT